MLLALTLMFWVLLNFGSAPGESVEVDHSGHRVRVVEEPVSRSQRATGPPGEALEIESEGLYPQEEPEPQTASESVSPGHSVWDRLAQCESSGDWAINTGNGYYGGLQFNKESWDWAGGQQYAKWPHHASREQQIATAERLLEIHPAGWGAWPACSRKLGLR